MKTKTLSSTTILILFILTIHSAQAEILFQDNFNRPNNQSVGNGWIEQEGSFFCGYGYEGQVYIQNNQLTLNGTCTSYSRIISNQTARTSSMTFKIAVSSVSDGDNALIYLGNGVISTPTLTYIIFNSTGQIKNAEGFLQNYTNGQTYQILINNINYTTFKYDLYIDNQILRNQTSFYSNANFSTIELISDDNDGVGATIMTLDDLISSTPEIPNIISFTTNNSTILNGTSTQINWITGNATNLDLSSINVSGLTAYNVSPTINTTYTLTATNENGSVNANLTINVYYPPPCIPSYYCSQTGTCNASNTIPCLNVSDLNTCGIPYNPLNYSDYNQACNYTTTGYVASYEASDAPKALFDFVVAIFVGMAGVAVLIGLGIALGIFTKSDTGKNLLKNLKR